VVLDPGHGGRDPGAIGHRGLREKDVNLGVALHLRRYLQARGVRVVMTREDDSYPSLQARADLANRTPDSVFISIHANAVSRRRYEVRGVETFVLSNSVSDWKRVRKAAMSFKVRRESGEWLPRSHQRTEIGRICKEARGESIELARSVHGRLVAASGDIDRGVRGKNLHVLRESFFSPAILVELGFLTHPLTARQLASDAHRRRLARALCDGICRYLLQREREEARVALRDNRVKVIANN
jgi:N-acetylmuramoyl-L-alanine amidase